MPNSKDKFWNFQENEETGENELLLYGSISSSQSWWDDNLVTHKQFAQELADLGKVENITVRINSGGGDVFAADAIYTLLKDNSAKITVKIDGWAASAATIVAMAGDVIKIPKNGIMMIHNPSLALRDNYTAEDLEKMSDELKIVKQSIINAYVLKTGKSDDEISKLMDDETWYLGEDAVENGFADEILFDESANTVVENSSKILVNDVVMDCSSYHVPIKLLNAQAKNPGEVNNKNTEVKRMPSSKNEIATVEDLKTAYPDLTSKLANEATESERNRIKDIEDISLAGYEAIISDAKFEHPVDAAQVAIKIVAEQKKKSANYLNAVANDAKNSGVNDVPDDSQEQITTESEDNAEIENALKRREANARKE